MKYTTMSTRYCTYPAHSQYHIAGRTIVSKVVSFYFGCLEAARIIIIRKEGCPCINAKTNKPHALIFSCFIVATQQQYGVMPWFVHFLSTFMLPLSGNKFNISSHFAYDRNSDRSHYLFWNFSKLYCLLSIINTILIFWPCVLSCDDCLIRALHRGHRCVCLSSAIIILSALELFVYLRVLMADDWNINIMKVMILSNMNIFTFHLFSL